MHSYNDTQESEYCPQQLFDLVIDIERYPEFLPWCRAARILERHDNRLVAELVISFKHFTESYVSEVVFRRPQTATDSGVIDVKLVRGPFEALANHWSFMPRDKGGSAITLDLSFKFRSRLLDSIIGILFGKACIKMVRAFKDRADALYTVKS